MAGNDTDPLTPLQAQMLTPTDCYKVWLYNLGFSRTQKTDSSRATPTGCVTEKRCRLYDFAEGPFPQSQLP